MLQLTWGLTDNSLGSNTAFSQGSSSHAYQAGLLLAALHQLPQLREPDLGMAQIALQYSDPNIPEQKTGCEGQFVFTRNCFLPCQSIMVA